MRTLIGSLLAAVAIFPASALAQQVERRDDGPAGERGPPAAERRMPDTERFGPRPDRPPEGWRRPQRDDRPRLDPAQPAPRPDRTDADRDADRRADAWRRGPERGPDRAPPPAPGWRREPSPAPMPGWNGRPPAPDRTQADRDADRSADAWRRDERCRTFDRERERGDRDRYQDRPWDRERQARDDWNRNRTYDRGWSGRWNGGWTDDRGSAATWNSGRDSYRPRAWDRGWRNDRRFDFDAFRRDHRQSFHLPRYYGPSGWTQGYRRFGLGFSLAPPLWSQGYWIADPWAYRLPEAYGPYRWVRYYGDALLVDLRTGLVVDAVYELFW